MVSLLIVILALFNINLTAHILPTNYLPEAVQANSGFEQAPIEQQRAQESVVLASLQEVGGSSSALGDITVYPVENQKGVAVLFPQSHRYPGSSIEDPKNDNAYQVQQEIYAGIQEVHTRYGIKPILVEGDMYTDQEGKKVDVLQKEIEIKNTLESSAALLSSKDTYRNDETIHAVVESVGGITKLLDRKITLAGASYLALASGADMDIYGAENEETYNTSAEIVRERIYIQDRIAALSPSRPDQKLVRAYVAEGQEQNASDNLINLADGVIAKSESVYHDRELKKHMETIKNTIAKLSINNNAEQKNDVAPSRSNNPFVHVNNVFTLQMLLKQNDDKLRETVLNKRNADTAENFVRMLSDVDEKVGMIQFGAEHTEGLVDELNKRGITVAVVQVPSLSQTIK